MSVQELQSEVARLPAEERARLRDYLDALEIFSDAKAMEEWTKTNRAAAAGAVVSREGAMARLRAAGKRLG